MHVHVHVPIILNISDVHTCTYSCYIILFYLLQLSDALCDNGYKGIDPLGDWWTALRNKIDYNTKLSQASYCINNNNN